MAALDREAVEDYDIPGLVLMEDAGLGAFREIQERFTEPAPRRLRVFCGKGNNGGDGFVIARLAHNAGWDVRIGAFAGAADTDRRSDAGRNLAIVRAMGLAVRRVDDEEDLDAFLEDAAPEERWVDALLGTGVRGEVRGVFGPAIDAIRGHPGPVIAVDIPSGLDGASGEILGTAVQADLTVTFAAAKTGLRAGSGPSLVGELVVVPISIPREALERALRDES